MGSEHREPEYSCFTAIDALLAQNIGVTEDEFVIFSELELAAFSVPLQCRK